MTAEAELLAAVERHERLAVAVSGGVDSMLLAHVTHASRADLTAFHARSPAVPEAATARVLRHAERYGYRLKIIDAGELSDPRYRANPVNRCYYCKTNLYGRIRAVSDWTIASGTNRDDLGDFRPGLAAASEEGVVHPFVEAGLGKADIYALAAARGLDDIAALPAQPCLASRIETGIGVDADTLAFVERAEIALKALHPGADALRCRVTAAGVVIEAAPLPDGAGRVALQDMMAELCRAEGRRFAGVRPYRRGSAFLTAK